MGSIIFICAGAAEGGGEVVVAFLGEAEGVVVGFFYNGHRAGIAHETQAVVAGVVRAGGGFPLRSKLMLKTSLVVRCAFHSSVFIIVAGGVKIGKLTENVAWPG